MSKSSRVVRSKRMMQKHRSVRRQVRIAKSMGHEVSDEPHRYAKHNALNCNVPKCPSCGNPRHNGYTKDKLTMQEKRFYDVHDEMETNYEYE